MEARLKACVRQVVKYLHGVTEFQRDMVQELVAVPQPANVMQITQPPRLRRLYAIYPADAYGNLMATNQPNGGYEIVSPGDITTRSGYQMVDVAYIAGSTITIRAANAPSHLFMQYYQDPDVAEDTLETWLMLQEEDTVADGVRARYYQMTNNNLAQGESALFQDSVQRIIAQYGGVT
jgi:hypothetical protein